MDSRAWLKRQSKDPYALKAKKEGLRARSAFKLEEIQKKFNLVKNGDIVIELGSAPGGFTKKLVKLVGWSGKVIAIDRLTMEPVEQAIFIQGDVAMWMGQVTCTDKHGDITVLDKSWGYKKDEAGTLRIVLHHSSLPYQPE